MSALLLVVLVIFGSAAFREMRTASIGRATNRLERITHQLAVASGASSAPRIRKMRNLAADTLLVQAVTGRGSPAVSEKLVAFLEASRSATDSTLMGWEVWTSDGEPRLRSTEGATRDDSAVLAQLRPTAMELQAPQHSPFYRVGDRIYTWTTVPIIQRGRAVGILAQHRRLADNPQAEQTIRELIGDDVQVYLTSAGRSEWATIRGVPVAAPFQLPSRAASAARVDVDTGRAQYVAFEAVPASPWIIVLAEPEATVLLRPREFLKFILLVGGALLLVGTLGAWLLGRHLTAPLRGITQAAEALKGGNYSRRVDVTGSRELALLATTFNAMATGIGQAHADLADRNADLHRANEAKVKFLAMMSHELRTPLNAIGGYTELLELGLRGPVTSAQVADLARIRRSRDHLLSIINDILSFTRADAGHLTLALSDVHVGPLLADTMSALGVDFGANAVEMIVEPTLETAVVRADVNKLQQVVLNLLTNAVRFTEPGGEIRVSVTVTPEDVHLHVRDTGIGIPAEKLDAVFQPFVQVDSALTRQVGGAGLGLAVARELATAMGGTLTVRSEVGVGSVFTLTLRRVLQPAAVGMRTGRNKDPQMDDIADEPKIDM